MEDLGYAVLAVSAVAASEEHIACARIESGTVCPIPMGIDATTLPLSAFMTTAIRAAVALAGDEQPAVRPVHGEADGSQAGRSRPPVLDGQRLRVVFESFDPYPRYSRRCSPCRRPPRPRVWPLSATVPTILSGRGVDHGHIHPVAIVDEDALARRIVDEGVGVYASGLERRGDFQRLQIENVNRALVPRLVAGNKPTVELRRDSNAMSPSNLECRRRACPCPRRDTMMCVPRGM